MTDFARLAPAPTREDLTELLGWAQDHARFRLVDDDSAGQIRDGAGHGGGAIGGDERGRFGKLHQGGRRFAIGHCAVARKACPPLLASLRCTEAPPISSQKFVSFANVPKSVPKPVKTAPEEISEGRFTW